MYKYLKQIIVQKIETFIFLVQSICNETTGLLMIII